MDREPVLIDLALQGVETRVGGDHALSELGIDSAERVHSVDDHLLGDAAHFGNAPTERVELLVIGSDDMFRHVLLSPPSQSGR